MSDLTELPNIGKAVAQQLESVGIKTAADLKEAGRKEAWLRILEIDASACINRLYALEGAIRGVKKSQLSPECKADLRDFYNKMKKA